MIRYKLQSVFYIPKEHYKLYKAGKLWLIAGITTFGVGLGMLTQTQAVHADTQAANVAKVVWGTAPDKPQDVQTNKTVTSAKSDASETGKATTSDKVSPTNKVATTHQSQDTQADKTATPAKPNVTETDKATTSDKVSPTNKVATPDQSHDAQADKTVTLAKSDASETGKATTLDKVVTPNKSQITPEISSAVVTRKSVTKGKQTDTTNQAVITHVDKNNFQDAFQFSGTSGYGSDKQNIDLQYDQSSGILTLTDDKKFQAGTATLKTKISIDSDFTLEGELNIGSRNQINGGGDGIGIGFSTDNTGKVGMPGGGVGLAGLLGSNGWKVDTYWDSDHLDEHFEADPKVGIDGSKISTDGKEGLGHTFGGFVYSRPVNGDVNTVGNLRTDHAQVVDSPNGQFKPFKMSFDGKTKQLTVEYDGKVFSKNMGPDFAATRQKAVNLIISAGTGKNYNSHKFKIKSFDYVTAASVNVQYVDTDGNEIASAQVSYPDGEFAGRTYQTQQLDIPNYTFDHMGAGLPVSGILEKQGVNGTVIYVYAHQRVPVTPETPGKPGQPIDPNNPSTPGNLGTIGETSDQSISLTSTTMNPAKKAALPQTNDANNKQASIWGSLMLLLTALGSTLGFSRRKRRRD
ncbi:MucBP domain-containing protein [Lactiplantibacillus plantarum]|uniref:lectin-like domain-containing protein n=1 Tax=Lactiplantibacillus plantarum TaxID=1590 RepID=UPI0030A634E3